MAEYPFREIEKKWQKRWSEEKTFHVSNDDSRPKYYVLDMFPYPSGAGLHVGHPLGYIASDIYARYKRLKGYNVLHPMGYDAFGLPAEQYAIQTGQHPAITTENNIGRYREQLDNLGFSFDWDREVRTSDPSFYKWTQWIFIQLFHSWYNRKSDKAENISTLITAFELNGNTDVDAVSSPLKKFTSADWLKMNDEEKQTILLQYRLAYLSETLVNWCPQLGTVLANEEVKDGFSERGGFAVLRKQMTQWSLRITAYADRLLKGLDKIEWSESMQDAQRNWIGKSVGATINFQIDGHPDKKVSIFTTRPDTIFGVTFMTFAPEHEMVDKITTMKFRDAVKKYIEITGNRSERERMADAKRISGQFTGAYAIHPFTGAKIPIWISEYVLAGYGTGAVMAVPAHDSRDYLFAEHFDLPRIEVVSGGDISKEAFESYEGKLINSDFINGLKVKDAQHAVIKKIEEIGIGKATTNFRLRDAIFGRQRYWGEPFPVYYIGKLPYTIKESELPLLLPEVDSFQPTESGEPPLARAKKWQTNDGYPLETNTMPGWAGSSWYFLRYMDPKNETEFVSKKAVNYWQNVDLYIGGSEHATGHLLYVRFWTKFLYDLGYIPFDEPAKKLVNQGMIQGRSNFVYKLKTVNTFVSLGLKNKYDTIPSHVDVNIVDDDVLDIEKFKLLRPEYSNAEFILEDDKYICGHEVEKMSKRWSNVVNPDDVVEKSGADTLRLYEMFLGPLEQSKPWSTHGIEGVVKFLRKLWRLYHNEKDQFFVSDREPTKEENKILHRTIKKVSDDLERLSFNTSVSAFMICVNELADLKCNCRSILSDLAILIAPHAPHIAEELWEKLGNNGGISKASYPEWKQEFLTENTFEYPVSFNGKLRVKIEMPLSLSREEIVTSLLERAEIIKYMDGKSPKNIIIVPGRIINIVL